MTIPTKVAELFLMTAAFDPENPADPIDLTSDDGALYYENDSDLVVYYIALDGTATKLELGDDYTLSGEGMDGSGTITPIFDFAEAGGTLNVSRDTELLQQADYEENDGFPAETQEHVEDKNRLIDQDLQREILRCLRIPRFEQPLPVLPVAALRAGRVLRGTDAGGFEFADDFSGHAIMRQRVEMVRLVESHVSIAIDALNPNEEDEPDADVFSDVKVTITIAHRTYADSQSHDQIATYECWPSRKAGTGTAYANPRLISFQVDPDLLSFGFDPNGLIDDGAFTVTSSEGSVMDQIDIAITPGTNFSEGGPDYDGGSTEIFVTAER